MEDQKGFQVFRFRVGAEVVRVQGLGFLVGGFGVQWIAAV